MKNDIENIPAEIFDWMTSLPFEGLNTDMKRNVLQYFTKDEYNELHESNLNIQKALHTNEHSQSRKADLMELFDERYKTQKQPLRLSPSLFWKAASVLLLLSTLWFAFKKSGRQIVTIPETIVKVDTLFIEKPAVAMIPVKDTVYFEKSVEKATVKKTETGIPQIRNHNSAEFNRVPEKVYAAVPKPDNDFQILSVSSMNHISNTTKRNSMNDDSLEKNFKFVSM